MDKDPLLEQVRLFINDADSKAISANDISRKFSMGIKRATRILEQFNGEGIAPSIGGEVKPKPNTPTNQWSKITSQVAGASYEETEEFLKNFPDHEPAKTHLAILKEQDEVNRVAEERRVAAKSQNGVPPKATTPVPTSSESTSDGSNSRPPVKPQPTVGQNTTPKPKKGKPATGSTTPKTWNQLLKAHGGNAADIPQDVLEAHAKVYPKQAGPKKELTSRQNSVQPRATGPIPVSPAPTSGGGSGGKPPVTPPESSPLPEEPPNPKGTPPKRVSTEMAEMQENIDQQAKKDAEELKAKKAATAENKTSYPEERVEPKPGETAELNRPIPMNFAGQGDELKLPPALKGIGNLDINQFANSRTLFQNDVAVNTRGPKYSNVMHQKIDKEKFNATKEEFAEKKAQLTLKLKENKRFLEEDAVREKVPNNPLAPVKKVSSLPGTNLSENPNKPIYTATESTLLKEQSSLTKRLSVNADELDLELYKQYFDPEGIDNAKSGILSPMSNELATSRHGAISATAKGLSALGSTFVPGSGYATKETLEHGFGMGFKNAVAASRGEHLARFVSNANPLGASGRAAFTESLGIANRSDVQRFLQNRTFMNGVGAFGAPIGAAAIVGMGMHDMQDPGEILGNLATGGAVIGGFRAGKSAGAMLTPANSKIGRGVGMAVGGTVGAVTGGLVAAGLYGILNDASQNDSAIRKFAKKVGTKEMYAISQDTRESLTARQQALNKLAKSGLNDRAQLLRK